MQARTNCFTNLSVQPDIGKIMDSLFCGYYSVIQKTTVSVEDINIDQLILSHHQIIIVKIISIQEKKVHKK